MDVNLTHHANRSKPQPQVSVQSVSSLIINQQCEIKGDFAVMQYPCGLEPKNKPLAGAAGAAGAAAE